MSAGSATRVCLVSGGHPSSNPRLVKEADTLASAGYEVTVVHAQSWRPGDAADAQLLAARPWRSRSDWDGVGTSGYRIRRLCQRLGQGLQRVLPTACLPWAQSPLYWPLLERARAVEADLYIGHTLVALPVVAACARLHGSRYAFDVEDFHPGEREGSGPGDADWRIADRLLAAHLPGAAFVTTSSPLISEEINRRYHVASASFLNVFDPDESDADTTSKQVPTFYWFSQTVGPGRGLEQVIRLLGQLGTPVALELRGECSGSYRKSLEGLSSETAGGKLALAFLPTAPPDDMVRLAKGYTAGISAEQATCLNRDLCLTNKIFTYLAAGTPVLLTPTRAQTAIAWDLGGAALVIGEGEAGARDLVAWMSKPKDPGELETLAKRWSWRATQGSWLRLVEAAGFSDGSLRRA